MEAVFSIYMSRIVVLSALLVSLFSTTAASSLISSVKVVSPGGSELKADLATKPGAELDPDTIRADVQHLYSTRRCDDIEVTVADEESGKQVTFNVVPQRPRLLRQVHFSPADLKHRPQLPAGISLDEVTAQKLSSDYKKQLLELGYLDASVQPEIVPMDSNQADLVFHVSAGEPVDVGNVRLEGATGLDPELIHKAMKNLRSKQVIPGIPKIWAGFKLRPAFSEPAVDADLARIRSLYVSRGYFDALVKRDNIDFFKGRADVTLSVNPGERYSVQRWSVQGSGFEPRTEYVEGEFNASELCACLFSLWRAAQARGHWDWSVRMRVEPLAGERSVGLIATVEPGPAYTVRRIAFSGNRKYSDGLVRANFLLDEAAPLDPLKLRKSIDRLNRSRLFEPLDERSVEIRTSVEGSFADVRVNLRERKMGSWLLSGPVGPMSVAGPLQFMLASRLPSWGAGVLEASTYIASFSLLAQADPISRLLTGSSRRMLPVLAIQRPFTPGEGWKSGFTIAPQFGWKSMALSYGTTQLRERMVPWLQGNEAFTPALPVPVERENGEAVLLCEPADARLRWLRKGAAVALQFAGFIAAL
jgi:outer membrane protein assembly factor BamA